MNRIHRFRPTVRLQLHALEARETPSTGGLLDPTFGSGGVVSPASTSDRMYDLLIQPDGKVVTAGSNTGDFLLARYNANGTADTTFGTGGRVTTGFKSGSDDTAWAVAIQPGTNGKLIAAGATSTFTTRSGRLSDFALARYNPNGTLDTTFGTRGKVITDLGTANDVGWSMVVQPDGRIVVAGEYGNNLALVRYTANGALDPTFGSGGKVLTNIALKYGGYGGRWVNVALQSDGRVVAAGAISPGGNEFDFLIARFTANGSFDTSFGSGTGQVATAFPGRWATASGLAIQPDGRIVAAGGSDSLTVDDTSVAVARYNPDGSLDTAFGTGGTRVVYLYQPDPTQSRAAALAVAIQEDGRIVLGGEVFGSAFPSNEDMALRLNPDGSTDTGYGTAGSGFTIVPVSQDLTQAVAIQSDGKAVFVTDVGDVFRLLPSAPQVGSFAADPNPAPAGATAALSADGLTDGNVGAAVTQVAFYADTNGDGVLDSGDTLLGYGTNNNGTWTLAWSTAGYAAGTYTVFAQATDSLGAVGDPASLSLELV